MSFLIFETKHYLTNWKAWRDTIASDDEKKATLRQYGWEISKDDELPKFYRSGDRFQLPNGKRRSTTTGVWPMSYAPEIIYRKNVEDDNQPTGLAFFVRKHQLDSQQRAGSLGWGRTLIPVRGCQIYYTPLYHNEKEVVLQKDTPTLDPRYYKGERVFTTEQWEYESYLHVFTVQQDDKLDPGLETRLSRRNRRIYGDDQRIQRTLASASNKLTPEPIAVAGKDSPTSDMKEQSTQSPPDAYEEYLMGKKAKRTHQEVEQSPEQDNDLKRLELEEEEETNATSDSDIEEIQQNDDSEPPNEIQECEEDKDDKQESSDEEEGAIYVRDANNQTNQKYLLTPDQQRIGTQTEETFTRSDQCTQTEQPEMKDSATATQKANIKTSGTSMKSGVATAERWTGMPPVTSIDSSSTMYSVVTTTNGAYGTDKISTKTAHTQVKPSSANIDTQTPKKSTREREVQYDIIEDPHSHACQHVGTETDLTAMDIQHLHEQLTQRFNYNFRRDSLAPARRSNVIRCFRCQHLGHRAYVCREDEATCGRCSENHDTRQCNNNIRRCANCGGNHCTAYEGCPTIKDYKRKHQLLPLP